MTVDKGSAPTDGGLTFMDFIGHDGQRLGNISSGGSGHTGMYLESTAGDFAEW